MRKDHEPSGYCTTHDIELFHGNPCHECNPWEGSPESVVSAIRDLIDSENLEEYWTGLVNNVRTDSFQEAGVLTNDAGFVLTVGEHKYQITVVKCRR